MDMQLFSFGDEEIAEIRKSAEETVNEAIGEALRKNLYRADVTIKISVDLRSENDEHGYICLVPEYEYKSGYKIGGKYDGAKGKSRGKVGVRFTREGFYESVMMPEQLSMVE